MASHSWLSRTRSDSYVVSRGPRTATDSLPSPPRQVSPTLPPIKSVRDLIAHGDLVALFIRERGEDNDDLIMAYETGELGGDMPQGSIKAFRQYADYMSLCTPPIPVWPITSLKAALFLLFRLLMGDVSHGAPLRDQYLRGLARSLEHFREDTALRFLSSWPETAQLILRDGRGAPEGRNDLTHDILRICKLAYIGRGDYETHMDVAAVERLVCGGSPHLQPDAWATRRRLSSRWVRDRDAANLPERQYPGGKFVGAPPPPPVLSGRSTRWNRHLHDLRTGGKKVETSWVPSPKLRAAASIGGSPGPLVMKGEDDDEMEWEEDYRPPVGQTRGKERSPLVVTPPSDSLGSPHTPTSTYQSGGTYRDSPASTISSIFSTPSQHSSYTSTTSPGSLSSITTLSGSSPLGTYGGRRRSVSDPAFFSYADNTLPPVIGRPGNSGIFAQSSPQQTALPSLATLGIHPSSFPAYQPLTPPPSASGSHKRPFGWTATGPRPMSGHSHQHPFSHVRSTSRDGFE